MVDTAVGRVHSGFKSRDKSVPGKEAEKFET